MRRVHVQVVVCALILSAGAVLVRANLKKMWAAYDREQCMWNFKQLSFALDNHASSFGKYPRAVLPSWEPLPSNRLSWMVEIVGDLTRSDLSMRFDRKFSPWHVVNAPHAAKRIAGFVCPFSGAYTESSSGEVQWRHQNPRTDIVGVSGVGPKAVELPEGDPRAGMFGYDRDVRYGKIPDGASNTLMLMEVSSDVGRWAEAGAPTTRSFEPKAQPYLGENRPFGGWHRVYSRIGTSRVEGCTMALADGSVRNLTNDISPAILEALATVAGKEPVPANW